MCTKFNIAIFTKNNAYAYKIRNLCRDLDVQVDYVSNLESLFFFFVKNNMGVILIDMLAIRVGKFFKELSALSEDSAFTFVFLNDNKAVDISVNNKSTFLCSCKDLSNVIKIIKNRQQENITIINTTDLNTKCLEYIVEYLDECGVSPGLQGYKYIKECVITALKLSKQNIKYSKQIYPVVAEKFKTNPTNVEKNIRMALSKAALVKPEVFKSWNLTLGQITNCKFLNYLVEQIQIKILQGY